MYSKGVPRLLRVLAGLAAVVALGLASYWSLRLAWAESLFQRGSPEAVAQAIRMEPENFEYRARAAALSPAEADARLHEAVSRNPLYARGWIELGLQAEISGEFERAEEFLRKAADADRTYVPLWTLANYYFRRGDAGQFWEWARSAVSMAYHDQSALFDLCWRMTNDAQVVLERAIPESRPVLGQYLNFLLRRGNLEAAGPVALRLVEHTVPGHDINGLLRFCDRLLQAERLEEALGVWNALAGKRLVPYTPLDPESGRFLTNGDFQADPLSHGFDWRIHKLPGVMLARVVSPRGLRLSFTGRQPEHCRILEQTIPLVPLRQCRLRVAYRTSGIPPGSGLGWELTDTQGRSLLQNAAALFSAEWAEDTLNFSAPAAAGLARLMLVYRRPPGTTRFEGVLFLREVSVDCPVR